MDVEVSDVQTLEDRKAISEWLERNKSFPRRALAKRFLNLRDTKLELEASNQRLRKKVRRLKKRVAAVEGGLNADPESLIALLAESERRLCLAKFHNGEMRERIIELQGDCDRLQKAVDKFRDQLFCTKCEQTKSYKCFPRNVRKPLGRDNRCNICQREKTIQWRAAKVHGMHAQAIASC